MGWVSVWDPRSEPQTWRGWLLWPLICFEDASHKQLKTLGIGTKQINWEKKIPAGGSPRTQVCTAALPGKQIPGSTATARVWYGALATKQRSLPVRTDSSSSHWWLGRCHQPALVSVSVSPVPTALPGHPDWAALIAAWPWLVSVKTTQITAPLKTPT